MCISAKRGCIGIDYSYRLRSLNDKRKHNEEGKIVRSFSS